MDVRRKGKVNVHCPNRVIGQSASTAYLSPPCGNDLQGLGHVRADQGPHQAAADQCGSVKTTVLLAYSGLQIKLTGFESLSAHS